jgi:arsenate reductase-like glutaredoxin family protein
VPGPVQIIKETEIKIVEVEKNNVVDSNEILLAIAKLNEKQTEYSELQAKLAGKDDEFDKLIRGKDEEFRHANEEKDKQVTKLLGEKDESFAKLLAEKDAEIARLKEEILKL